MTWQLQEPNYKFMKYWQFTEIILAPEGLCLIPAIGHDFIIEGWTYYYREVLDK